MKNDLLCQYLSSSEYLKLCLGCLQFEIGGRDCSLCKKPGMISQHENFFGLQMWFVLQKPLVALPAILGIFSFQFSRPHEPTSTHFGVSPIIQTPSKTKQKEVEEKGSNACFLQMGDSPGLLPFSWWWWWICMGHFSSPQSPHGQLLFGFETEGPRVL